MIDKSVFNKLVPPTIRDVKIYFSQKGIPEAEAEAFFLFQEKRQWAAKEGNSGLDGKPVLAAGSMH